MFQIQIKNPNKQNSNVSKATRDKLVGKIVTAESISDAGVLAFKRDDMPMGIRAEFVVEICADMPEVVAECEEYMCSKPDSYFLILCDGEYLRVRTNEEQIARE